MGKQQYFPLNIGKFCLLYFHPVAWDVLVNAKLAACQLYNLPMTCLIEHWKDYLGQINLVGLFSIVCFYHFYFTCCPWQNGLLPPESKVFFITHISLANKDLTVILLFGIPSAILSVTYALLAHVFAVGEPQLFLMGISFCSEAVQSKCQRWYLTQEQQK